MKTILAIAGISIFLSTIMFLCWEKSWDNKCAYWETLPHQTEMMKELCQK